MSTMDLSNRTIGKSLYTKVFDLDETLRRHSWCSFMGIKSAEEALSGCPKHTYLLRPSNTGRGFAISFVDAHGNVHHDHFTLINAKYGIFKNAIHFHCGCLEQVLSDMMECSYEEMKPLR